VNQICVDQEGKLAKVAMNSNLPYENEEWGNCIVSLTEFPESVSDVRETLEVYGNNWQKQPKKFLKVIWLSWEVMIN
jgi:hypothetical protein